ncbi:MAG: cytochrome b/b6 domain-containing protein [Gulosibacter sp.]|uniref:cytochrome b/b6 domain-containing protein n=1 Tax=Gulosibacter sp. TaxID=2817531 RepID=UPI003F93D085
MSEELDGAPRKQRMGKPPREVVEQRQQHASEADSDIPLEAQPPKRTRMGTGNAPSSARTATPAHDAGVSNEPMAGRLASRQRMGGTGPASGGTRQRMGAGNSDTANSASGGARTRMGASPAAASAATSAEPDSTPQGSQPPGTQPKQRIQPAASASTANPAAVRSTADSTKAGDASGSNRWIRRAIWIVAILVVAVVLVLVARWLRGLAGVQDFLAEFPGHSELPENAPVGLPGWIGWQHFFNMFFMVLIVRTGLQVRLEKKAPAYWKPKERSFFSPRGATPKKVSLSQWLHQSLDVLWMLNGLVFIVLLFVSGQWMRIVPMSWDIVPNALSSALQYASLDWPTENGWVYYNALQLLAYFTTVFIAAPLAVISGIRFSTWWPDKNTKLSKIYPVEVARAIHFPVMLYFVAFTIVHVFLVFFTGALRNLNHMYTSRDVVDWWGLAVFAGSVVVIAAAWILTQPIFMRPLAARTGTLSK